MPFDCLHRQQVRRRHLSDRLPGDLPRAAAATTRASSAMATSRRPTRRSSTSPCSTCITAGRISVTRRSCTPCRTPCAICSRVLQDAGLLVSRDLVRRPARPAGARTARRPARDLHRHRRTGTPRSVQERRRLARLAGHSSRIRAGSRRLFALFDAHSRGPRCRAARRVPYLRRDVPVAGRRRRGAARTERRAARAPACSRTC